MGLRPTQRDENHRRRHPRVKLALSLPKGGDWVRNFMLTGSSSNACHSEPVGPLTDGTEPAAAGSRLSFTLGSARLSI
jgi:hypothetical protein